MKRFVNLKSLSKCLNLSENYLKQLSLEGKIPVLYVNGRLRFNPDAVRSALDELASKGGDNDR